MVLQMIGFYNIQYEINQLGVGWDENMHLQQLLAVPLCGPQVDLTRRLFPPGKSFNGN